MKNTRGRFQVLSFGFLTACLSLATLSYAGDEKLTLRDLCERSSDIIAGRVLSAKSYFDQGTRRIFTKIEIEVTESMKGGTRPSDTIALSVLGGTVNGITTIVVGGPKFAVGERSILFMSKVNTSSNAINYVVYGLAQGKFNLFVDQNTGIEKVIRDHVESPLHLERGGTQIALTDTKSVPSDDFLGLLRVYLK